MTVIHIPNSWTIHLDLLILVISSRRTMTKEYPAIKMHSMYVNEFAADKRKRAFIILCMSLTRCSCSTDYPFHWNVTWGIKHTEWGKRCAWICMCAYCVYPCRSCISPLVWLMRCKTLKICYRIPVIWSHFSCRFVNVFEGTQTHWKHWKHWTTVRITVKDQRHKVSNF